MFGCGLIPPPGTIDHKKKIVLLERARAGEDISAVVVTGSGIPIGPR